MAKPSRLPQSFYYFLVFLFLYIPYIKISGVIVHLPYFYPFLLSTLFIVVFAFRSVAKDYFKILLVLTLPYFWLCMVSLLNGVVDSEMQINFLNSYLSILGAFGLSIIITRRFDHASGLFLVKSIYYSGVLHAIIMVFLFFVSPVRDLVYSFVVLGVKGQDFVDNMYRSPGLTTGGGDALSVVQSIALVFGLYYFLTIKNAVSPKLTLLHLIAFIFLFLSILLSARTGFVVLFLGISMLGGMHLMKTLSHRAISRSMIIKASFLIIVFSTSLPIIYLGFIDSSYSRFSSRAFELYINLTQRGQVGTSSTEHLRTMFFLPDTTLQLSLGDGNFGRDESLGIIPSDVGYVRVLFGGGILGVFLFFVPLILSLFLFYKKANSMRLIYPLIFVVAALLVVNVKVYHLYGAFSGFKVYVLIIAMVASLRWRDFYSGKLHLPSKTKFILVKNNSELRKYRL